MRIFAELFTLAKSTKRACYTVSNLKWFFPTTVFQKNIFAKLETTKKFKFLMKEIVFLTFIYATVPTMICIT